MSTPTPEEPTSGYVKATPTSSTSGGGNNGAITIDTAAEIDAVLGGYRPCEGDRFPDTLARIVRSIYFSIIVYGLILLNLGMESARNFPTTVQHNDTFDFLDDCLTFCYLTEAVMKILVFGPGLAYFRCWWNCFDFIVVVVSVVGFTLEVAGTPIGVGFAGAARIVRIVRLMSISPKVRLLFTMIATSAKRLFNIVMLLVLFLVLVTLVAQEFFESSLSRRCHPVDVAMGVAMGTRGPIDFHEIDDEASTCRYSSFPLDIDKQAEEYIYANWDFFFPNRTNPRRGLNASSSGSSSTLMTSNNILRSSSSAASVRGVIMGGGGRGRRSRRAAGSSSASSTRRPLDINGEAISEANFALMDKQKKRSGRSANNNQQLHRSMDTAAAAVPNLNATIRRIKRQLLFHNNIDRYGRRGEFLKYVVEHPSLLNDRTDDDVIMNSSMRDDAWNGGGGGGGSLQYDNGSGTSWDPFINNDGNNMTTSLPPSTLEDDEDDDDDGDDSLLVHDISLGMLWGQHVCPYNELCIRSVSIERGMTHFDSISAAVSVMYNVMTLEGWTALLYPLVEAQGVVIAGLFFVIVIGVGNFFLMNLTLVVILDAFERSAVLAEIVKKAVEETVAAKDAMGGDNDNNNNAAEDGGKAIADAPAGNTSNNNNDTTNASDLTTTTAARPILKAQSSYTTTGDSEHKQQHGRVLTFAKLPYSDRRKWFGHYRTFRALCEWTYTEIVGTTWYRALTSVVLLSNLIVETTAYAGMTPAHSKFIADINIFYTIFYIMEVLLKFLAYPFPVWRSDTFNLFDAFVTITSTIELIVSSSSTLSILRCMRFLKVVSLSSSLRLTLATLVAAFKGAFPILAFVLLLIFLFAVLGMQIFASKMCGVAYESDIFKIGTVFCEDVPRGNFDNMGYAAQTMLAVATGEAWRDLMTGAEVGMGETIGGIFFTAANFVLGYIMVNLFVAVIINSATELKVQHAEIQLDEQEEEAFVMIENMNALLLAAEKEKAEREQQQQNGSGGGVSFAPPALPAMDDDSAAAESSNPTSPTTTAGAPTIPKLSLRIPTGLDAPTTSTSADPSSSAITPFTPRGRTSSIGANGMPITTSGKPTATTTNIDGATNGSDVGSDEESRGGGIFASLRAGVELFANPESNATAFTTAAALRRRNAAAAAAGGEDGSSNTAGAGPSSGTDATATSGTDATTNTTSASSHQATTTAHQQLAALQLQRPTREREGVASVIQAIADVGRMKKKLQQLQDAQQRKLDKLTRTSSGGSGGGIGGGSDEDDGGINNYCNDGGASDDDDGNIMTVSATGAGAQAFGRTSSTTSSRTTLPKAYSTNSVDSSASAARQTSAVMITDTYDGSFATTLGAVTEASTSSSGGSSDSSSSSSDDSSSSSSDSSSSQYSRKSSTASRRSRRHSSSSKRRSAANSLVRQQDSVGGYVSPDRNQLIGSSDGDNINKSPAAGDVVIRAFNDNTTSADHSAPSSAIPKKEEQPRLYKTRIFRQACAWLCLSPFLLIAVALATTASTLFQLVWRPTLYPDHPINVAGRGIDIAIMAIYFIEAVAKMAYFGVRIPRWVERLFSARARRRNRVLKVLCCCLDWKIWENTNNKKSSSSSRRRRAVAAANNRRNVVSGGGDFDSINTYPDKPSINDNDNDHEEMLLADRTRFTTNNKKRSKRQSANSSALLDAYQDPTKYNAIIRHITTIPLPSRKSYSYFASGWHWMEFICLVAAFVAVIATEIRATHTHRDVSEYNSLEERRSAQRAHAALWYVVVWARIIRNFRLWSFVRFSSATYILFKALIRSFTTLRNAGIITLLFWYMYSVLGLMMFRGKINACTSFEVLPIYEAIALNGGSREGLEVFWRNVSTVDGSFASSMNIYDVNGFNLTSSSVSSTLIGSFASSALFSPSSALVGSIGSAAQYELREYAVGKHSGWGDMSYMDDSPYTTKETCIAGGYLWLPYPIFNFDNILNAMLVMFQQATVSDWLILMYLSTDAQSETEGPRANNNLIAPIYFITFLFIMGQFLVNFIKSALIDGYFSTKADIEEQYAELRKSKEDAAAERRAARERKRRVARAKKLAAARRAAAVTGAGGGANPSNGGGGGSGSGFTSSIINALSGGAAAVDLYGSNNLLSDQSFGNDSVAFAPGDLNMSMSSASGVFGEPQWDDEFVGNLRGETTLGDIEGQLHDLLLVPSGRTDDMSDGDMVATPSASPTNNKDNSDAITANLLDDEQRLLLSEEAAARKAYQQSSSKKRSSSAKTSTAATALSNPRSTSNKPQSSVASCLATIFNLHRSDRKLSQFMMMLTSQERYFFQLYRYALYYVRPPLVVDYTKSSSPIRWFLRAVVRSRALEFFQCVFALIHVFVMSSMNWPTVDDDVRADSSVYLFRESDAVPSKGMEAFLLTDGLCTAVFVLIMLTKMFVYGFLPFIVQRRNWIDILINATTVMGCLMCAVSPGSIFWTSTRVLLFMRVWRIHYIFFADRGLLVQLQIMMDSGRSFVSVLALMCLLLAVFSSMGMALFGRVAYNERNGFNHLVTFETFPSAFMLLFRVCTGDAWGFLLNAASTTYPNCSRQLNNCGDPVTALIFFFVVIMLGSWVALNLFTAVLMEGLVSAEGDEQFPIQEADVRQFQRQWKALSHHDESELTLTIDELQLMLVLLNTRPLGLNGQFRNFKGALPLRSQAVVITNAIIDTTAGASGGLHGARRGLNGKNQGDNDDDSDKNTTASEDDDDVNIDTNPNSDANLLSTADTTVKREDDDDDQETVTKKAGSGGEEGAATKPTTHTPPPQEPTKARRHEESQLVGAASAARVMMQMVDVPVYAFANVADAAAAGAISLSLELRRQQQRLQQRQALHNTFNANGQPTYYQTNDADIPSADLHLATLAETAINANTAYAKRIMQNASVTAPSAHSSTREGDENDAAYVRFGNTNTTQQNALDSDKSSNTHYFIFPDDVFDALVRLHYGSGIPQSADRLLRETRQRRFRRQRLIALAIPNINSRSSGSKGYHSGRRVDTNEDGSNDNKDEDVSEVDTNSSSTSANKKLSKKATHKRKREVWKPLQVTCVALLMATLLLQRKWRLRQRGRALRTTK